MDIEHPLVPDIGRLISTWRKELHVHVYFKVILMLHTVHVYTGITQDEH